MHEEVVLVKTKEGKGGGRGDLLGPIVVLQALVWGALACCGLHDQRGGKITHGEEPGCVNG